MTGEPAPYSISPEGPAHIGQPFLMEIINMWRHDTLPSLCNGPGSRTSNHMSWSPVEAGDGANLPSGCSSPRVGFLSMGRSGWKSASHPAVASHSLSPFLLIHSGYWGQKSSHLSFHTPQIFRSPPPVFQTLLQVAISLGAC